MNTAIFAFTENGTRLALQISDLFQKDSENSVKIYTMKKFCSLGRENEILYSYIKPVSEHVKAAFSSDALIFIGAVGIAVRMIAPYLHHKTTDPCVLVLDELGNYVIPILSGHIGGGNELALKIAAFLHALPVITTATDINHLFAVDTFASKNNLVIKDMKIAKEISAALLERQKVGLLSELPFKGNFPSCLIKCSSEKKPAPPAYGIHISISDNILTNNYFPNTLYLIPKITVLGIGCRKGTACSQIENAVSSVLREYHISPDSLYAAASIDIKAEEPGLLEFCEKHKLNFTTYAASELEKAVGSFSVSSFVKDITGVDNVCERAALTAACTNQLLIKKQVQEGVTVAAALKKLTLSF